MKFFPVVAAASLALASVYAAETTTTAPATAATCDLTKLRPLLTDTDLTKCSTSSGLVFPPSSTPSADIIKKACAVPECSSLLKKVAALNLGDCLLGAIKLNSQLIQPVSEACAKLATSSNSTTTAGNSTTAPSTATPVPTTTAPATTEPTTAKVTTAPVTVDGQVGSAGSAGSGSSDEFTEEKSNSTVSATSSPSTVPKTGSASSLSMAATGAVVSAVVVALF